MVNIKVEYKIELLLSATYSEQVLHQVLMD